MTDIAGGNPFMTAAPPNTFGAPPPGAPAPAGNPFDAMGGGGAYPTPASPAATSHQQGYAVASPPQGAFSPSSASATSPYAGQSQPTSPAASSYDPFAAPPPPQQQPYSPPPAPAPAPVPADPFGASNALVPATGAPANPWGLNQAPAPAPYEPPAPNQGYGAPPPQQHNPYNMAPQAPGEMGMQPQQQQQQSYQPPQPEPAREYNPYAQSQQHQTAMVPASPRASGGSYTGGSPNHSNAIVPATQPHEKRDENNRQVVPAGIEARNPYSKELAKTASGCAPLPKAELVKKTGFILSRISFRTIVMKKWKQSFWVQYGSHTMLWFRSQADFNDWLNNPYLYQGQRNFLLKLAVNFVHDLYKPNVRGYQVTQARMKPYGNKMVRQFKLERWMDYGPTIAAAFGSYDPKEVDALREAIVECMRNTPLDGGIRATGAVRQDHPGNQQHQQQQQYQENNGYKQQQGGPGDRQEAYSNYSLPAGYQAQGAGAAPYTGGNRETTASVSSEADLLDLSNDAASVPGPAPAGWNNSNDSASLPGNNWNDAASYSAPPSAPQNLYGSQPAPNGYPAQPMPGYGQAPQQPMQPQQPPAYPQAAPTNYYQPPAYQQPTY